MLNNFCFHVYAQMSLFTGENVNAFLAGNQLYELKSHRWGCWSGPKKTINEKNKTQKLSALIFI